MQREARQQPAPARAAGDTPPAGAAVTALLVRTDQENTDSIRRALRRGAAGPGASWRALRHCGLRRRVAALERSAGSASAIPGGSSDGGSGTLGSTGTGPAAEPVPVHPQLFRHARVRQIVRSTRSLPLAQKQAGWSRLQTAYLSIGDREAAEMMATVPE
jgi:hypothetical protein